jgi:hypothetical protein
MRWEDEIYGKVRKQDWLEIGAQVPTRQTDPIDSLFGDDKTDNIVASWESIASQYNVPMMAQFHGFDTEANTTFRVPIDTHNIEKGLIKVKINQSERLRALTRTGVVGNDQLYNYVMDDGIRLADQVITRTKVAKNELMATGKVTIKENNLDLTVDYGVPSSQTQFTIDFSGDADVSAQLQEIIDAATAVGVTITGMMTSKVNLTKMRKNKSLQIAINGTNASGQLIKSNDLFAYLEDEFGITTVVTNDLTYGASAVMDSNGRPVVTTKRYYPQNKITFFATNPGGKLGTGLWGNPPEEDAARFHDVGTSGISPYVYIMQWMETDPAVLWTKASSLFIPVLYNPNSLFIATVDDDSFTADLTVTADATNASYPWTDKHPSDFQSSIAVSADGKVTGTLNFMEGGLSPSGQLAGDGYFLALKWSNPDTSKVTSLKVGLEPGHMAPQECIEDTDRNGVFKIENKNTQKVVLIQSDGNNINKQTLDLSGLTLGG